MMVYINHISRLMNLHMLVYLINIIWCLEGVAEVDGGYDEQDCGAEVLPPLEDHGMEVESEEWVERHQVTLCD